MSPLAARGPHRLRSRGFTLLELLVVVTIIAVSSAVVALALPDPRATRLEREGQRLVTLFESARAHARSFGLNVTWRPAGSSAPAGTPSADFLFEGLPADVALPRRWLQGDDTSTIGVSMVRHGAPSPFLSLGPEPFIGPQSVVLQLGERRLVLTTDGLGPFAVQVPQ